MFQPRGLTLFWACDAVCSPLALGVREEKYRLFKALWPAYALIGRAVYPPLRLYMVAHLHFLTGLMHILWWQVTSYRKKRSIPLVLLKHPWNSDAIYTTGLMPGRAKPLV